MCMHAQNALSTTAAFPYGQLGAAMPVAVALALFANVNMAFGRGAPAPAGGDGAPALAFPYHLHQCSKKILAPQDTKDLLQLAVPSAPLSGATRPT